MGSSNIASVAALAIVLHVVCCKSTYHTASMDFTAGTFLPRTSRNIINIYMNE
jgi:hypothetical protein